MLQHTLSAGKAHHKNWELRSNTCPNISYEIAKIGDRDWYGTLINLKQVAPTTNDQWNETIYNFTKDALSLPKQTSNCWMLSYLLQFIFNCSFSWCEIHLRLHRILYNSFKDYSQKWIKIWCIKGSLGSGNYAIHRYGVDFSNASKQPIQNHQALRHVGAPYGSYLLEHQ